MHPDTLGWAAAALMVAAFSCKEARHLRPLAVATNLAFIGYGVAAGLWPVLVLHAVLLPINLWRWRECWVQLQRPESTAHALAPVPLKAWPIGAPPRTAAKP